jgi:hypothetical protein
MRRRAEPIGLTLLCALVSVGGCTARALTPSPEDPLRDRIRTLEEESRLLRLQNEELRASIERDRPADGAVPAEVVANAPIPVRIAASFGSAVPATDGPSAPLDLTVHVVPLDGRERFVQMTGWVDVTVVTFTANPAEAVVLATRHFEPGEVRDALRSGFFGIHYGFTLPLPADATRGHRTVVARVLYRDGFTRRELESIAECPLER